MESGFSNPLFFMVGTMVFESSYLEELTRPLIEKQGCELVEIRVKGSYSKPYLQVFVDRDGGVRINDCADITRSITEILDMNFPDISQYRLEVSSPGVHRPLETEKDFKRNTGRTVVVQFLEKDTEKTAEGEIIKTEHGKLVLQSGKEMIEIPLEHIRSGRIQLRW